MQIYLRKSRAQTPNPDDGQSNGHPRKKCQNWQKPVIFSHHPLDNRADVRRMSVVRHEGFPLRVHHSSIDPNCLGEQGEGRK